MPRLRAALRVPAIIARDARYALRQLLRAPGFTAVAVLSLALGLGANITIFSAAQVLVRGRVAAQRPDELVRVYRNDHSPLPRDWFLHVARQSRQASALLAEDLLAVGVEHRDERERVPASIVSENFFGALGVSAAVGSVFHAAPGTAVGPVVVLGHDYWRSRYGGDRAIIGRTLRINDLPFTVLGVAPADFRSSEIGWGPRLFLPFSELARLRGATAAEVDGTSTYVTARLAPGASASSLRDELRAIAPDLPRADSTVRRADAFMVEPARGLTAEARGPATVVSVFLMAMVTLLLLIACANLGNLLLARATARQREIAVRSALGVSRARLVQQLLTESMVLTLLGGLAGLALAWYATQLLPAIVPADAPIALDLRPDGTVLAFAATLALGTGLVFGLAPALRASTVDLGALLRAGADGSVHRSRLRSAFLGAQVALALTLLVTSGLFVRGLAAAQAIDPGFDASGVANLAVDLGTRAYDADRSRAFQAQALERVRALPHVAAAALIGTPPLVASNSGTEVARFDAAPDDRTAARGTMVTGVSDGYFDLMRIRVLDGEAVGGDARAGGIRIAVVNESFARMLWPDARAVGQRFRIVGEEEPLTVVGLVADLKYKSYGDVDEPLMFLPLTQWVEQTFVVQARVRALTPQTFTALRDAVQSVDPGLAIGPAQSAEDAMAVSLLPARIGAMLLGAFGAVALLLCSIGVYGVTAYVVGLRTREIGIRTALGAPRALVLRLLMSQTMRIVLLGIAVGLAAAGMIGRLVSGWLYGVSGLDALAFGCASGLLVLVAALGTWWPARRALDVEPLEALRAE